MTFNKALGRVQFATLAIFILIAAAIPTVFARSGEMPLTVTKEARALFMQGLEKSENLEDVGTLFDQAVQKDPNFAFGYLYAGQNNVDFQKSLETAVRLSGKASPGEREWILAAQAQANNDPAGQLDHLQRLVKLYPRDKRVQTQLALYYRGIGDEVTALRYFNESIRLDKKYAPAYNNIGYTNMALGNFSYAETAFKTYIKLIPNNPNPYDSYAELLMNTGRYDESIKQYNMALSKDPTFVSSYRGIGNDYGYKGDYGKSRETYHTMYERSLTDAQRDQALSSTVNSYIAEGNIEKALEVNERRRAKAESDGDWQTVFGLYNLAGGINFEFGNYDAAAKQFAMAVKVSDEPSFAPALRENRRFNERSQQARLMAATGDFDGAQAQLDAMQTFLSTRQNVNQERNYNQAAGYVALKQKNYVRANEFFAKANQNDPLVWCYQAAAFAGAGDAKSSADLYKKIIDANQLDTVNFALARPRAVAMTRK